MSDLPVSYRWLYKENLPPHMQEAISHYGVTEITGPKHSAIIMGWIKNLGRRLGVTVKDDETPWCGVFVGHCIQVAGFELPDISVRAKSWLDWGKVEFQAMLGDVLIFNRPGGGGHVGFYVGEDDASYHVLGGNQNNAVSISRIAKYRCIGIRRCPWKMSQPHNVRRVRLGASGSLSQNEA